VQQNEGGLAPVPLAKARAGWGVCGKVRKKVPSNITCKDLPFDFRKKKHNCFPGKTRAKTGGTIRENAITRESDYAKVKEKKI